jgi:hypothetical protein
MISPNNKPNQTWTEMVAASREESPPPVDVRYSVRAALESLVRNPRPIEELDWSRALVKLFSPGFVRLGVAAAFLGMLVLAGTTAMTPKEVDADYDDPLVTLYSDAAGAEWSDWL